MLQYSSYEVNVHIGRLPTLSSKRKMRYLEKCKIPALSVLSRVLCRRDGAADVDADALRLHPLRHRLQQTVQHLPQGSTTQFLPFFFISLLCRKLAHIGTVVTDRAYAISGMLPIHFQNEISFFHLSV